MRNCCSLIGIRDCCPSKIKMDCCPSKTRITAVPPRLVETVVTLIGTWDCGLNGKHLLVVANHKPLIQESSSKKAGSSNISVSLWPWLDLFQFSLTAVSRRLISMHQTRSNITEHQLQDFFPNWWIDNFRCYWSADWKDWYDHKWTIHTKRNFSTCAVRMPVHSCVKGCHTF